MLPLMTATLDLGLSGRGLIRVMSQRDEVFEPDKE